MPGLIHIDASTVIKRAQQFRDYNVLFLEEPLSRGNLEGYPKLTSVSSLPIAAGEGELGRFAWRHAKVPLFWNTVSKRHQSGLS